MFYYHCCRDKDRRFSLKLKRQHNGPSQHTYPIYSSLFMFLYFDQTLFTLFALLSPFYVCETEGYKPVCIFTLDDISLVCSLAVKKHGVNFDGLANLHIKRLFIHYKAIGFIG